MKIKTIEQARELGLSTYSYKNGNWEYRDTEGYHHFFRNGEELLPEIKKLYIYLYANGDYEYEDTKGFWHLFRNDKELLPEIKKLETTSYPHGDWRYVDTKGYYYTIKGNTNGAGSKNGGGI